MTDCSTSHAFSLKKGGAIAPFAPPLATPLDDEVFHIIIVGAVHSVYGSMAAVYAKQLTNF